MRSSIDEGGRTLATDGHSTPRHRKLLELLDSFGPVLGEGRRRFCLTRNMEAALKTLMCYRMPLSLSTPTIYTLAGAKHTIRPSSQQPVQT